MIGKSGSDCVAKIQGMSFSEIVSLFDRFFSLESFEERPKSRDRIFSDVRTGKPRPTLGFRLRIVLGV